MGALLPQPIGLGGSSPADPTKLSFLSLPGEVRNRVYDILFKATNEDRRTDWYPKDADAHIAPTWTFYNTVALFLVCRQVYHEGATALLSNNEFIIPEYYLTNRAISAATWLRGVGSRACMLRKVYIDLSHTDRIKLDPCWDPEYFPDLGTAIGLRDLLEFIWDHRDPRIDIGFMHAVIKSRSWCPRRDQHFSSKQTGIDETALNHFFKILRYDPLFLQQYLPQIKEVLIQRNCTEGTVLFSRHSRRDFAITEQGKTITWKQPGRPTLMGLPSDIKNRIFAYVACNFDTDGTKTQTIHDLDERTTTGSLHALISVCQELRKKYASDYRNSTQHVVKMAADQPSTDFDQFEKLKRFWCIDSERRWPWDTGSRPSCSVSEFSLHFRVSDHIGLEDISINILPFIRVTSCADKASQGQPVQVSISIIDENDAVRLHHSLSLKQLRELALVALSEYAHQYPGEEDQACPSIWMNGRGQIFEVESGNESFNPQPYIDEYLKIKAADEPRQCWVCVVRGEHSECCERCEIIHEMYGVGPVEINEQNPFWYYKYAPKRDRFFEGSLLSYLDYLQRVGLGNNARIWALEYFMVE